MIIFFWTVPINFLLCPKKEMWLILLYYFENLGLALWITPGFNNCHGWKRHFVNQVPSMESNPSQMVQETLIDSWWRCESQQEMVPRDTKLATAGSHFQPNWEGKRETLYYQKSMSSVAREEGFSKINCGYGRIQAPRPSCQRGSKDRQQESFNFSLLQSCWSTDQTQMASKEGQGIHPQVSSWSLE